MSSPVACSSSSQSLASPQVHPPSRSGYRAQPISGIYKGINIEKLQDVLSAKFSKKYEIMLEDDNLTVYAPCLLSRADIKACSPESMC